MRTVQSLVALGVVVITACGGGGGGDTPDATVDAAPDAAIDAAVAPPFRNPVDLTDAALAQQAAAVLGVSGAINCNGCHSLTRARLQHWDALTDAGEAACLTDLNPSTQAAAMTIVQCLRDGTPDPGQWHPSRIGIDATAAGLPWFEYVFRLAYGDGWEAPFADWKMRVEMPRGEHPPLTQGQFDIVAEWFARGLPQLDVVVPFEPPPPPCTTQIMPEIAEHVAAMRTQGWRAINRDDGINMFACQDATDPRECLAAYPDASSQPWGVGWNAGAPGSRIKLLREITYSSAFWTRSSADGRFVAHGGSSGGGGSTVIDLQQDREIRANASYDPGFFPDNSGFIIQGGGAHFCRQTLLTSSPESITFNEPECRNLSSVGLYQHLGAVRGGDYWTVHGQFSSDNGGGGDPGADFGGAAQNRLTPIIYDGTGYVAKPQIAISTPNEGDMEMSPSSRLLISRVGGGPGGQMTRYTMRKLTATPAGSTYTVNAPIVGEYCVRGGKPGFSYDDRWIVYHHNVEAGDWASLGYASASEPGFLQLLQQRSSNLFVLDLTTGEERRITMMGPGQLALFPHFRSDGWIYAIVKDRNRGREVVIASDAALMFEQP